nr:hypothetical protein [uncultured Flavobacterium sp.]
MEFKVTTLKHLEMLLGLILATIFWLAYIVVYPGFDYPIIPGIISVLYVGYLIPALYLHLNYSSKSGNKSFKIDNKGISITENGRTIFYKESRINEIVIYGTASKITNGVSGRSIFEHYFYAEIKLREESLFITSLLSKDIDKVLSSNFKYVHVRKVKCFYPTIQARVSLTDF